MDPSPPSRTIEPHSCLVELCAMTAPRSYVAISSPRLRRSSKLNAPRMRRHITPSALSAALDNLDSCGDATGAQKGGDRWTPPDGLTFDRDTIEMTSGYVRSVSSDDAARVYDSVAAAHASVGSTAALATAVSDKMPFDGAMWTISDIGGGSDGPRRATRCDGSL
jgi:hypothetical protein